ncbi:MAG: sigma-70 family RNA polymerase sigma factor [Phycisphaeraceae bacterium]|nr:sigma-70 family RNA polymerase sigma factor [Phycisphaeraceae bacterium]
MPSATSILPITLAVADGPTLPTVTLERDGDFEIGRGSGCDLQLDDERVSRRHAVLAVHGGRVTLRDENSTRGVWLNGVRLDAGEDMEVHDRDLIGIAPWSLLVRFSSDEDDTAHIIPEPKPLPADPVAPASTIGAASSTEHAVSPKGAATRDDPYRTHPSIFLRLRADGTLERQLGWEEFNRVYGPVIAGFARNAGLKPQEVDDVMQDVLLGFFRVANNFIYDPSKGRFRGYLKRVTLNAIRSRRRRRRPQQNLPEEIDPAAETSDLEVAWEREWTEHLLRRALDEVRGTVQPKTMKAFELYGVQGMPAEEVAKETGMSEPAIRHAKMRVLDQLRATIRRLRDEEG